MHYFKERGVDLEVVGVRYMEMHRGLAPGRIRTGPASFKGRISRTGGRSQCMPLRVYTYMSSETPTCEVPSNGVVDVSLLPLCSLY